MVSLHIHTSIHMPVITGGTNEYPLEIQFILLLFIVRGIIDMGVLGVYVMYLESQLVILNIYESFSKQHVFTVVKLVLHVNIY